MYDFNPLNCAAMLVSIVHTTPNWYIVISRLIFENKPTSYISICLGIYLRGLSSDEFAEMHLIYSSYHSILSANCLCIIASLFFSADAFKQSPLGQQDHSPLDHSFNEIVHAKLSQYHAPGVAVAVVQDKLVTAKVLVLNLASKLCH